MNFWKEKKSKCLVYIDLNPIRAGLVERPEEYRWSSLDYRFRTGRNDSFLSWNLGLKEYNVKTHKERLRLYRKSVYARGGVDLGIGKTLEAKFLTEGVERLIQRTRFFTESGIIGSRGFARQGFELFRDIIQPKRKRRPHKIQGLDQIYPPSALIQYRMSLSSVQSVLDKAPSYGGTLGVRFVSPDDDGEAAPWLISPLAAFQNPEFYKAQAMRFPTYGKPRIMHCCEDFSQHIGLPGGCLEDVKNLLHSLKIEAPIVDKRFAGSPLDVSFTGTLRPDQQQAADALLEYDTGPI